MATRVLLLTQWFDPEPTFKGLVFARELISRGFEVEVLTGFPNYPGGKIYPGYRLRFFQRELIDGVSIIRVPLYPSHDRSSAHRVLNYLSFFISATIFGIFKAKRPDVIYVYHPPLTVGISGVLIGFFRRAPMVYDVQDMWPDSLTASGMVGSSRIVRLVGLICRWVYRRADAIVVLSLGFKKLLVQRGVASEKIQVIQNWCDESAVFNLPHLAVPAPSIDGRFRILFAGNFGAAQALSSILEAAALLSQRMSKVHFLFLGSGIEMKRLEKYAKELDLDNISFLPRVPMSEVGGILASADALLVHLKDSPLFRITIPSKTQAYMAAGKPILMAVQGDAAKLVEEAGCGVIAKPQDPESIAAAATALESSSMDELENMGARGKAYYDEKLSVKAGVDKFSEIFEKLAGRRLKKSKPE